MQAAGWKSISTDDDKSANVLDNVSFIYHNINNRMEPPNGTIQWNHRMEPQNETIEWNHRIYHRMEPQEENIGWNHRIEP